MQNLPVPADGADTAVLGARRRWQPVHAWAALGASFLALEVWVLARWVQSGDVAATGTGDDPVPAYMRVIIHGAEVGSVLAFIVFGWCLLVRPWQRERRITLDGLFCLVFASLFWQDTLSNYLRPWFTYNAEFINLGNWDSHVPGWASDHGSLLAAPLFIHLAYVWGIFGAVVLGCGVMRRAVARWPGLPKPALVGVAFGWFVLVEGVAELSMLLSGVASYPGSIAELTLFHGHYYQFPIYEWFLFAGVWTSWACLRFFRDDRGRTWPERGIDAVRLSPSRTSGLRFLALAGAANALFLVAYSIPNALFGLAADPWPDDVLNRSYFSYLCQEEGEYPCPEPATGRVVSAADGEEPSADDAVGVQVEGPVEVGDGTGLPEGVDAQRDHRDAVN